jgi:predicted RND superfamily exporter protein
MDRIARAIVNHRRLIIVAFIVLTLVCAPLILLVKINYNMIDYLPEAAPSTTAIDLMAEQFDEPIPNAEVLINDVSLVEAQEWKQRLAAIEGVRSVMWLDDVIDLKQPIELADQATVEGFYRDGKAHYQLIMAQAAVPAVTELIGPDNALAGEAPSMVAMQEAAVSEVTGAFVILVPAIIVILALCTTSWLEPLLLLLTIGISIVINMGTNIVYGNGISFITNSVAPILQLAVSLDYAIIFLHSFSEQRELYPDVKVAMRHAIKISLVTVTSSASATFFGFLSLVFMAFLIGADLGINLAKGIAFSFICVMFFLPALTLCLYKLMDKLQHRPLLPSFKNVHKVLLKIAVPIAVIVIVALVPSYLGQERTAFLYGSESAGSGTRAALDAQAIEDDFGSTTIVAVLVPKGDIAREKLLGDALASLDHVTSVMSYAQTVGAQIPPDILDSSITGQFYSDDYARLILYTDTATEGDEAFATVAAIQTTIADYYPDDAYALGRSPTLYDMMEVVQADNTRVNLIAIVTILLVLLITFRSLILPFLLLITIEPAIWINLSIPYFTDVPINYIGYLVLNTVQLAATVDYAILLSATYMRFRRSMPRTRAIREALASSFKPILMSACVLSLAGFTLFITSSNAIVCDIGLLLGRGTLISFVLVVSFLPALLWLFDPLVKRLSFRPRFYVETVAPTASLTSSQGEPS